MGIGMRRFIMLITAPLALASCGNNDQAANTQNIDESLAAENIVANDITAIDAVTGAAANMAADVEITNDLAVNLDNGTAASDAQRSSSRPARPPAREVPPAQPEEPASNAAVNSTD